MSRKIERLINLTIALLATKRFLTKNEIFRSVEGYEGSDEAKERMFERDKDDLRNLGVEILVGSFDPVFEDEAGYRIKPENYNLNLGEISGKQLALLSLAAEAWRGAALDDAAHSALKKLQSMGIDSDLDALPVIAPRLSSSHDDFQLIATAISKRRRISFAYLAQTLDSKVRVIEPYAIATKNSHWYVSGRDIEKSQIRTFRLDRIDGEITLDSTEENFEIPRDYEIFDSFGDDQSAAIANIKIRKGKAHLLRSVALTITDEDDWDLITVNFLDARQLIDLVLWHGEDAVITGPDELRLQIIEALTQIRVLHE